MAYLKIGNAKRAEEILTKDGGLNILDFREGDRFLDELYRGIRKSLYGESDSEISVPEQFDFIVSGFWGIIMHTVKYFKPAKKWREALPPGKTQ